MEDMPDSEASWRGFATHLTVVEQADGTYEGWCLPGEGTRPYGGHLVAQALMLVLRDCTPGMTPMSVHAHFLAIGDTRRPIVYRVEFLRAGRSFEHWRVEAAQDDVLLSQSTVVLHRPEPGPEHAVSRRSAASPEGLVDITSDPPAGTPAFIRAGLEIRRDLVWAPGDRGVPFQDAWFRCIEELPEGMDSAVLAWCTDLEFARTVELPFRDRIHSRVGASLEHTIHFHRPFDATQWWVFEQETPALAHGRGLATGRAYSEQGELVATVIQHTMLRLTLGD
jgi:acyl-CoA thioesterase II